MPAPSLPIASLSSVARAWDGVFLLLVECPFCPKTHTHGGGADPDNVAAFLSDRSAHCANRADSYADSGYVITDVDGILPAEVERLSQDRPRRR